MKNSQLTKLVFLGLIILGMQACRLPNVGRTTENKNVPASFSSSLDTTNTAAVKWKSFFSDTYLNALIDTALKNNQELNITLQEIQIAMNEVRARKGEYLPFMSMAGAAGLDKVSRYTSRGASDDITQIAPGKATPEVLPDYMLGVYSSWEIDVWHKLRNAKKAAFNRFLGTVEGKNFLVTSLIAEIANSYYELLALDNQLEIVLQNIEIQSNALKIVKLEKEATRVTELAVRRFEAEVFHTRSLQFDIQQKITVTENRINYLVGRYPQKVNRNSASFSNLIPSKIAAGIPSQLLENRRDVKRAELELIAAKIDVKVAKARFYPSINIRAGLGFQAFNPSYLMRSPQAIMYSIAGDIIAPLVNRNAIKAAYYSANSKQIQAIYNYERTILNAFIEVSNQLSNTDNLQKSYELRSNQVQALNESIAISTTLFKSARADYMEVLLTQRDALESKFELVETQKQRMNAMVNIYKALGGGWN